MNLDKIVLSYIKDYQHEFMMVDKNKKYKKEEITNKIFSYQLQLNKIWGKSKNRGIAILLERDVEYICLIFAIWLSKGFYLPFSEETPRENINQQLKDSKINYIAQKKKNKIQFKNLKNKNINK